MDKKQYTPDAGMGYKASYVNKENEKVNYIKLSLDPDYIASLPRTENGRVTLAVFPKTLKDESKRTKGTPDYDVKGSNLTGGAKGVKSSQASSRPAAKQGGANDWVI